MVLEQLKTSSQLMRSRLKYLRGCDGNLTRRSSPDIQVFPVCQLPATVPSFSGEEMNQLCLSCVLAQVIVIIYCHFITFI